MSVKELWLVRHGESIANEAATRAEREGLDFVPIDVRDADVPLSVTGREQATALGSWLKTHGDEIDAYCVSPYLRARETLAIALAEGGLERLQRADERLRDRELGILDLLTRHGVARLQPGEAERRRRLGKFYHRPPGGESWVDVSLRLRSFLRDELERPAGTTMIVGHDAVVMLLLFLLLGMDEKSLLDFASTHTVLNASLTHLVRTDSRWELTEFANVDHLQREGAPVTIHPGSPDVQPQ